MDKLKMLGCLRDSMDGLTRARDLIGHNVADAMLVQNIALERICTVLEGLTAQSVPDHPEAVKTSARVVPSTGAGVHDMCDAIRQCVGLKLVCVAACNGFPTDTLILEFDGGVRITANIDYIEYMLDIKR